MPVIRVSEADYERIAQMKCYLSITKFITYILDKAEQPKRSNPELKKKSVHPLFNDMKLAYLDKWKENNGFEARWQGVTDATALNRLIRSLESLNESEQPITALWKVILDKLPNFYKDKTINAINKNLNGIIAEIKQEGNTLSDYEKAMRHFSK